VGARTYHLFGVPLRTGSLYPGNENDARPLREARLAERLRSAGCDLIDEGDIAIPSYLPHHSVPPIRNWPGPRIAWDCVAEQLRAHLAIPGHVPLLVGCDCSIVVGTTQALLADGQGEVHVIYIDGDLDQSAPQPASVQSAAAVATWILTHASPFWSGPPLQSSQLTIVGTPATDAPELTGRAFSLAMLREVGPQSLAKIILQDVPRAARVVVHFDVDAICQRDMPAAYFPHAEGMTLQECTELLRALVGDPRVSVVEVAEYAALRDLDQRSAHGLIELLEKVLP
jgi:arginase family enzyme